MSGRLSGASVVGNYREGQDVQADAQAKYSRARPQAMRKKLSFHVEVSRFAVVGIWNTLLDYSLFIGLTKLLSIPLDWVWTAKAFSGAVAIANSYVLNRIWVFRGEGMIFREGAVFLTAAIIGVYAIQTPLTQLFSSVVPEPGELAFDLASAIGLTELLPGVVTEPFAIKTTAFAIAVVATTVWSYVAYRYWVFGEWRIGR
jgi:putative flippase GtrA